MVTIAVIFVLATINKRSETYLAKIRFKWVFAPTFSIAFPPLYVTSSAKKDLIAEQIS